jgi:hypothetical protein
MSLSKDEKTHLTSLVEANIHSTIVSTVLSELSEEDKKTFLKNLVSNNHRETLNHLKTKVTDLEGKIKKSINELKKEMLKDLLEAKRLSEKNQS